MKNCVQFIESKNRNHVDTFLSSMQNHIDLIIPRGGKNLVKKSSKKINNFNYWSLRGLMSCLCR